MRIIFSENAWEDYLSWHQGDKKNLKKINELIKSIARTPRVFRNGTPWRLWTSFMHNLIQQCSTIPFEGDPFLR